MSRFVLKCLWGQKSKLPESWLVVEPGRGAWSHVRSHLAICLILLVLQALWPLQQFALPRHTTSAAQVNANHVQEVEDDNSDDSRGKEDSDGVIWIRRNRVGVPILAYEGSELRYSAFVQCLVTIGTVQCATSPTAITVMFRSIQSFIWGNPLCRFRTRR